MGKKKQYDADAWGQQRERSFWGVLIAALVVGLAFVLVLRWVIGDSVAWVESRFGSVAALALILSSVGVTFGLGGMLFGAHHTRATAREAREDTIDAIGQTAGYMGTMAKVALEGAKAERAALGAQIHNDQRVWRVGEIIGKQYGRAREEAERAAQLEAQELSRLEDYQGRRPTSQGGPRVYD